MKLSKVYRSPNNNFQQVKETIKKGGVTADIRLPKCNFTPQPYSVVYFVNSGSEANELAILMARIFTKNYEIISLRNGYHGMSNLTMNVTAQSHYKYPTLQAIGTHHVVNPDVYKGLWGGSKCRDSPVQALRVCSCKGSECEAKDNYIKQFKELFDYSLPKKGAAAFIAESIQGVGGTVQYPKGYLKEAADIVRKHGGLFIADEVQTGFGRTGEHFWGFEMHGLVPDIVTMAKGIGNGFPLGAVVTTPTIANALTQAAHFNTFGGNPVSCAAGLATLEIIEDEKLQENSGNVGTYLLLQLEQLRSELPIIGDVRGKGLMIGVELVAGSGTNDALPVPKFMKFWDYCREQGLIVGRGGIHGNVLRIKPPMCVTKEDADFCVKVIKKASEKILLKEDSVYVGGV
ncbi:alanine--glyoxylate aminotransferase 2, mitochondrial-like [Agrilus planipennis]|uniref:Alanine--glyoxylate aminotransferase 2, mitochondrial n=1 Tax=Agrilus planipennis TaxID=224129 RepID=A0A7F5QXV1_AGRPL|nr:alanine--glyoxylate aminotransferase 2, mitochondrial-like [Agrilus planipennis]